MKNIQTRLIARFTANYRPFSQVINCIFVGLALSACGQTTLMDSKNNKENNQPVLATAMGDSAQVRSLAAQPLFSLDKLNGNKVMPVKLAGQDYWLANSENIGLFVFADIKDNLVQAKAKNSADILLTTSGNFEGLAYKKLTDSEVLVASVNKELGQLELFSLVNRASSAGELSFIAQKQLKLADSVIDNLCLYQAPASQNNSQGHIYAFLLTAQNQVEQHLIYDGDAKQFVDYVIRRFPSPPDSQACTVDDATGQLYIAEEQIGIWQYSVEAEKALTRKIVGLTQPYGLLNGEIKDLSILSDGSLLVALPQAQQVQRYYQLTQQQTNKQNNQQPLSETANSRWYTDIYQFDGSIIVEGVSGKASSQGLQLALFNDDNDSYQSAFIPDLVIQPSRVQTRMPSVKASGETHTVSRFGDAADDPAIWVNRQNPAKSLILATDKSYGLYVYDLAGNKQHEIATGRINNIDIRYGFKLKEKTLDIAAASNRTNNSINLYQISVDGQVSDLAEIATTLPDVYGLCSYYSDISDSHYVFINDESGVFQQYQLKLANNGQVTGQLVREFKVNSQPEGCVADDKTHTLYLGEEDVGIWKISAEPSGTQLTSVYKIDQQYLFDDVEGLAIYHGEQHSYLVASSQGNDSYLLLDLAPPHKVIANFRISENPALGIDGASETDGLAVTSANLGGQYAKGLLVVQDGRNVMPVEPQNFKLVAWQDIEQLLKAN